MAECFVSFGGGDHISFDQRIIALVILRDGAGGLKTGCDHDSQYRKDLQYKFHHRMCQLGLYTDDEIWYNCEVKFNGISC